LSPRIETAAYPSVLNLFGNSARPVTGMTAFDVAYLDGLYHATRNARTANQQQGEIADRMDRTLNGPAPAAQQPAPPAP
jgi:hypothetical protein